MNTYVRLLFVSIAILASNQTKADTLEEGCVAPPPGLTQAAYKCYADNCKTLMHELASCGNEPACRAFQMALYHINIAACIGLRVDHETSENLVVWLNTEGEWVISWPGEEIENFSPRYEFNI